jgi:hypothetical protein
MPMPVPLLSVDRAPPPARFWISLLLVAATLTLPSVALRSALAPTVALVSWSM